MKKKSTNVFETLQGMIDKQNEFKKFLPKTNDFVNSEIYKASTSHIAKNILVSAGITEISNIIKKQTDIRAY